MANIREKTGPRWGGALKKGKPDLGEGISRANIEVMRSLTLKNEPDLVDGIMQFADMSGLKTAPEVIRHLLRIAISATPMDGESRAAIINVKLKMTQYLGKLFWGKVAEMMVEFEKHWTPAIVLAAIQDEIARVKAERGEAPANE